MAGFLGFNAFLGLTLAWIFGVPSTARYRVEVAADFEGKVHVVSTIFERRSYRMFTGRRVVVVGAAAIMDVAGTGWMTIPLYSLGMLPALAASPISVSDGAEDMSAGEFRNIGPDHLADILVYWHAAGEAPGTPHRVVFASDIGRVSNSRLRVTRISIERTDEALTTRIEPAPPWLLHMRAEPARKGIRRLFEREPAFLM